MVIPTFNVKSEQSHEKNVTGDPSSGQDRSFDSPQIMRESRFDMMGEPSMKKDQE